MKTLVRGIWKRDSQAICKGVYEVGELGVTVATSLLLSYNGSLRSAGGLSILLESAKAPAYCSTRKGYQGPIQWRLEARVKRGQTRCVMAARDGTVGSPVEGFLSFGAWKSPWLPPRLCATKSPRNGKTLSIVSTAGQGVYLGSWSSARCASISYFSMGSRVQRRTCVRARPGRSLLNFCARGTLEHHRRTSVSICAASCVYLLNTCRFCRYA
jgi:hypothetical protein